MLFENDRLRLLGNFAPLRPNANRAVTRLMWLTIVVVLGFEHVSAKAAFGVNCILPSLDEACSPPRTVGQMIVTDVAGWDWMLISGLITFALSLSFIGQVEPSFNRCIARLFDRGMLRAGTMDQDTLLAHFSKLAKAWALGFALLVAVAMALVWTWVLMIAFSYPRLGLAAVQVVLGFVAGGYLGQLACYGRFARAIGDGRVQLHLDPWHADQAAGIKPVGDFFFFQATFATIPAAFLAVWIWIMPLWERYDIWYTPYVALLCLAVLIQALAIFLPLGRFHSEMLKQKRAWRRRLDEEFRQNSAVRATFLDSEQIAEQAQVEAVLEMLTKRHAEVEAMPTWPIDKNLWKKFTFRNLLLLSPIVFDAVIGAPNWSGFVATIVGLFQ